MEEDKNFIFHLDGQTIILQDYLEIRPDKKDQIKKFVNSERLLIGPWYVLSDQFLTSGEASIRNLLYGIRFAKGFGAVMLIGYCPDQFGQIAQLPQILKGFNINSAIIGRGIQDGITEHLWYGLNGDSILAISLTHWYNNAQRIPDSNTENYINKLLDTHINGSKSKHILLMNGCDHLYPQTNLTKVLNSLKTNGKWKIKQTTLLEPIKLISETQNRQNYPIKFGELRDDNNLQILAGTLSSRVYLKLANYKLQSRLEKTIEPLSALINFLSRGNKIKSKDYRDFIKHSWKLLIQNHAHDSICGCSTDEVHKEMETRFLKVQQITDMITRDILNNCLNEEASDNSNKNYLQLINLTHYKRNEVIEAVLEYPLGPASEHPGAKPTINKALIETISLSNNKNIIPLEIIESKTENKMVRSKNEVPLLRAFQKIKILFKAEVKPFSVTSYTVEASNNEAKKIEKKIKQDLYFENDYYRLSLNANGTLSLTLKENKYSFNNMHFFSIEEDLGDEYNFNKTERGKILSTDFKWEIQVIEENTFRKRFLLKTTNKDIAIALEMACYRDSRRIDFNTRIENNLKNIRIQLHFPTNLQTNYITADTPFGSLKRPLPSIDCINYAYTQPLHNWIEHSNDFTRLVFFGGGISEYELYKDGNGFAITLLRAVGRLSSVESHSWIKTPDAQCNRNIDFNYSIYCQNLNSNICKLTEENIKLQSPITANHSVLAVNSEPLIELSSDIALSSFKVSEDKNNFYVLRIFNPTKEILQDLELKINFKFKSGYSLNLNEDIIDIINLKENYLFTINPFEILTFGFEV